MTTVSGKLFHTFTILLVKKYFLKSYLVLYVCLICIDFLVLLWISLILVQKFTSKGGQAQGPLKYAPKNFHFVVVIVYTQRCAIANYSRPNVSVSRNQGIDTNQIKVYRHTVYLSDRQRRSLKNCTKYMVYIWNL